HERRAVQCNLKRKMPEQRRLATAYDFTHDLAELVLQRVQITTDGLKSRLEMKEACCEETVPGAVYRAHGGRSDSDSRPYGEMGGGGHFRRQQPFRWRVRLCL